MSLLHDLFRVQASAHPDLPAVTDGVRTLTYKELDVLTDRLATELQTRGACVDSCVVIYMSKSIDYVVSYIAILKAGAAYLPMDAAYPIEMVNMVLQDAQPKVVIVSPKFFDNVKDAGVSVLQLVPDWEAALPSVEDAAAAFVAPVMVRMEIVRNIHSSTLPLLTFFLSTFSHSPLISLSCIACMLFLCHAYHALSLVELGFPRLRCVLLRHYR